MFFCQTFCSKKFSTAPLTLGFSQLINSVGQKSSVTNSGVKRVIFEIFTFYFAQRYSNAGQYIYILYCTNTVCLGKIKSESLKNDPLDTRIGHRALLPYTNKLWKSQRQRAVEKILEQKLYRKNTKKINDFIWDSTLNSRVLTGFFVGAKLSQAIAPHSKFFSKF